MTGEMGKHPTTFSTIMRFRFMDKMIRDMEFHYTRSDRPPSERITVEMDSFDALFNSARFKKYGKLFSRRKSSNRNHAVR